MDFDPRVRGRLKRDPERYSFEIVPISQISLKEAWNDIRLADNLKKIKASSKVPPVFLHFRNAEFHVEDGLHRINVAKILGYTHIPAIVTYEK